MEIKITADKSLLDALNGLAEALKAALAGAAAPVGAPAAKSKQTPAPEKKPAVAQPEPEDDVPTVDFAALRADVQQKAIVKIQSGKREEVKALVKQCGGTRVGDIPEGNLTAFLLGLEAIK